MSIEFLSKPIVAIVTALITIGLGYNALHSLPIELYPRLAPTSISVSTIYPGADAQTVEQSVATPLEQQITGLENMSYMTSVSSNDGSMTLNVVFDLKSNDDIDQLLLQMRAARGEAQLPEEVRVSGISTQKSSGLPLIVFALTSSDSRYDELFLSNYARIAINDQLMRVPGVGKVDVIGSGRYALRIWIKPDLLASLRITIPEIMTAIRSQSKVNPAGKVGAEPAIKGQQLTTTIRAKGRLESEEEFKNIVIKARGDGSLVRLGDVATIALGSEDYSKVSRYNGKPTALVVINQLPGGNALETASGLKEAMETLSSSFPPGMEYEVALDTTRPISEGIEEISLALIQSLILVVLIVFFFLKGWRETLIPLIAVPVSLLGAFCLFPFIGFTVNSLSLFGLVLAVGIVIDDPIVVIESIENKLSKGLSLVESVLSTMKEVRGPIIATTFVLIAVFAPTVMLSGITGRMYQQFSITVCVAVIFSAYNSLTLSPALASALLISKKQQASGYLYSITSYLEWVIGFLSKTYLILCGFLIDRIKYAYSMLIIIFLASLFLFYIIPKTFIQSEDQGFFLTSIQLPSGASLQRTDAFVKKVEEVVKKIQGVKDIASIIGNDMVSGLNSSYTAMLFVSLSDWNERTERELEAGSIIQKINYSLSTMPEAIAYSIDPPAIPGVGNSGGVSMMIEDRSGNTMDYLNNNLDKFITAARKDKNISFITTTLVPDTPQVIVEVDRDKAMKHGVNSSDIFETLQTFMGSGFVNFFNRFGRQWPVIIEAEPKYRDSATRIAQFYVKNKTGNMIPLDSLIQLQDSNGPEQTTRHNLFRSAQISAYPAAGVSTSQTMRALENIFIKVMPKDMGFEYTGMSYQEKIAESGFSIGELVIYSCLFVYLILAVQYESWTVPLSVIIVSPMAIFGALIGVISVKSPIDIYGQIGIVMLIGLSAKNSILIVEYANNAYKKGMPLRESVLGAAQIRFRPILMTALAFIFGMLPLVFATGAGAIARKSMGVVMLGGMFSSLLFTVTLTPAAFYYIEKIRLWALNKIRPSHDPSSYKVQ